MRQKVSNSDYQGSTQSIQKQFSLIEEIRDNLTISDNNFSGLKDIDYV